MIFQQMGLTTAQIVAGLLAVPAFIPATVCTGYLLGCITNLYGFRERSLIERMFWSLPLSVGTSTIVAVLLGRVLSLTAVVVFFLLCTTACVVAVGLEIRRRRELGRKILVGFRPYGILGLILACLWVVFTLASLVDIHRDHQLFMNVSMLDQSARILWTESVLHTGVPPLNLHYLYKGPAPMRNYYFWYVVCAAIAKMTNLPVRGVFTASCVWAGFNFVALIGLSLKHFMGAGARLRRQFYTTIALLAVSGLDVAVVLWNLLRYQAPPPADLEAWSRDGIVSWLHTLFWAPHHLVSMTCCMFAFLLAWLAANESLRGILIAGVLIALSLASAFGLSIYVTFAFFLVMVPWALWQIFFQRKWKAAAILGCGGALSLVLLAPYLSDLVRTQSTPTASSSKPSAALFSLAVRQMIPPNALAESAAIQAMVHHHDGAAKNIARAILLAPGYMLELGFFFAVLLAYSIPALRNRQPLTAAQKSLLCIVVVTLPITSFIRSGILQTNDFAWRSALYLQFPLLLLASDLVMSWRVADGKELSALETSSPLPGTTPQWLRTIASFALILGIGTTTAQALLFRFLIPIGDGNTQPTADPNARNLSQKAYISAVGYAELDRLIPQNAVVQYNPADLAKDRMSMIVNMLGIDHQSVITSDGGTCGSDLGGDPSGCPMLAAAIDSIYNGASADEARRTCQQLGIQYLVVRIYDPVWKNKNSWVWNLKPVVADEDFRAVDCR